MGEFFSDLGKALRAWGDDPRLPLLTAALFALAGLGNVGETWLFVIAAVTWVLLLGFHGTQRAWYRAIWEGRRLSLGELAASTRSFFLPFLGLGVIFTLFTIPLAFTGILLEDVWARVVPVLILDMLFTFVTPALVFTTRGPLRAVSYGFRMLKAHWRHGLPYIVVPPLMVQALWASPDIRFDALIAIAVSVAGGLIGLLFKGATAVFYLRHGPEPEEEASTSQGRPYGGHLRGGPAGR